MSVAFVESVKRCTRNATFLDRFYDQLLSRHASIRERFAREDAFRTKFLLNRLLMVLVRNASGMPGADHSLDNLAREYGADGLNLPEVYYRDWLEALLRTVRQVDSQITAELDAEWRKVMSEQMSHFIARVKSHGPVSAGW